jgi:hypothetical protein
MGAADGAGTAGNDATLAGAAAALWHSAQPSRYPGLSMPIVPALPALPALPVLPAAPWR